MYRCYLKGGRICQASPPTCPSWTGRMDDNNKLMIIFVSILYRCTIYGPLGIFKSPVAPFVLLFRLFTDCPFLLPRAKPLYIYILTLLLSRFWTSRGHRCRPFFPPASAFNLYRALGSAIPLLVDFSSCVANSRSRAFRKSICAQEKVPTN